MGKRRFGLVPAAVRGTFRLGHPPATLVGAMAGTGFYFIARRSLDDRIGGAFLFAVIFCVLYSIGAMNDYCDEPRDRAARRSDKPLIAGDLTRSTALVLWIGSAALGVAAGFHFGPTIAGAAFLLWLAGVAYNFGLKGTAVSWLPLAVFFPSLPVLAFAAAGRYTPVLLLSYPVGLLLSVGLNIANTLPDLESDARSGVQGFVHRLGLARALPLLWVCLLATLLLMGAALRIVGGFSGIFTVGATAAALLLLVMIVDWLAHRSSASLRRIWYASALYAAVASLSWIASLP